MSITLGNIDDEGGNSFDGIGNFFVLMVRTAIPGAESGRRKGVELNFPFVAGRAILPFYRGIHLVAGVLATLPVLPFYLRTGA
jgi:hypothetical protein